jgi:hypothetical protein
MMAHLAVRRSVVMTDNAKEDLMASCLAATKVCSKARAMAYHWVEATVTPMAVPTEYHLVAKMVCSKARMMAYHWVGSTANSTAR